MFTKTARLGVLPPRKLCLVMHKENDPFLRDRLMRLGVLNTGNRCKSIRKDVSVFLTTILRRFERHKNSKLVAVQAQSGE